MSKRLLSSILILSMFFVTMSWVPTVPFANLEPLISDSRNDSSQQIQGPSELSPIDEQIPEGFNAYNVADDAPADGVLDPVTVEQSGYAASENLSARTDSFENLDYNLPLDVTHNWSADVAEVSVWNLEKLYAVNGTFNEGIPGYTVNPNGTLTYYPFGWSAISNNTDPGQSQQVSYEQGGDQYVTVQNTAKLTNLGLHQYTHYGGTNVFWVQTFENAPYTDQFLLQFDYLLLQGPLSALFTGEYSLKVFIDDEVVSDIDLPTLSTRGTWFDSGSIPVTIGSPSASMTLKIGIVINSDFVTDADEDYDGDGSPDGAINTQFITVYLDDVSLIKATPPTPAQVQLEFTTGGSISPLSGSGTYTASITNSSYWTTSPVSVALTSNTSVSFDYKTRLFSHRFTDSNWRTNISSTGVAFSIDHGISSALTFYTYVGYLGNYEDPKMVVIYPEDWENLTVSDPFLSDLTSSCTIGTGNLTVPTSILDRLGWWQIRLESPNYAKSIRPQLFDVTWSDATIFRIGNATRGEIEIGTAVQTPGSLSNVNITWFNPSNQIWNSELQSGALGQVTSGQYTFNSGSSPAGEWWLEVYWTNGTEIAYGRTRFEVHHFALLAGDPIEISTDTGLEVTGLVRYSDSDTGAYLMDGVATLVANWSGGDVTFVANPIQNWWEGDFDTSLSGEGDFVVVVNATRPYYDDISCQIIVHSVKVTRLNSPNAPWSTAEWGDLVPLTFNFESYNFGTELWGPVANESDISVTTNWDAGYWTIVEDVTPGVFILTLNTSVRSADTWLLNTTFSKPYHESKTVLLTLIVSPTTSSLSILEGISARVDLDESYPLTLRYLDQGSSPIIDADVIVDNISPPIGLDHTPIVDVGGEPGNYSVTLTPRYAGVFTVRFVSNKTNYENATAVFVLVVNDVATHLDISGTGSVEIGLTDVYNTTIRFEMYNGTGVPGAQINVSYTGGTVDALTWGLVDIGLGDYSIEFSSTASGTYLVTIAAFKPYHQSDSDAFFLVVREITTNMTSLNGTRGDVGFGNDYRVFLSYTNGTGHGLIGANISVEDADAGLLWAPTDVEAPGVYSILLTPLISYSFTILIEASLPNHQTKFVFFTLTVSPITATLTLLNGSTPISLDQSYAVYLLFQDGDLNGLENSSLSTQTLPDSIVSSSFEELGSGYYRVILSSLEVGAFDIVFSASKDGYQTDYATFTLTATRVPTRVVLTTGLSSGTMDFGTLFDIFVLFERTDTEQNISDASIALQTTPATGLDWDYEAQGDGYLIVIDPERTGNWTIEISASRKDHSTSSVVFLLEVNPVQLSINLVTLPTAMEGSTFNVIVKLTEQVSNRTIDDAAVTYRFSTSGTGLFRSMESTGVPGEYFVSLSLPMFANPDYQLEIKAEKENYVLTQDIDVYFGVTVSPRRLDIYIAGGSGTGISLIVFFVALRIHTRKKREQIEVDVANKRRFDDADNIIGVIVLHKKSGIPVYSRIVKGGFEEGIVAAFISAVTHFREEFEMFDDEAMKVIPISDIIRAVQTKSLICAFITLRSASIEHNRKMEAYGEQVATYLDDFYTESRPSGAIDSRIAEILDYVFDETMDGSLVKFFKVTSDKKFPRRLRLLEQLLDDIETHHCSRPVHLAQGVATFGVSEARGCTLVLEAIEQRLILQCDEHEPKIDEMEFADFFKENNDSREK